MNEIYILNTIYSLKTTVRNDKNVKYMFLLTCECIETKISIYHFPLTLSSVYTIYRTERGTDDLESDLRYRCQVAVTIVGIAYRYITRIDRTLQQALTVITITKLHCIIIYFAYFRFYTIVIVVGISHRSTSTCFLYRTMITVVIVGRGHPVNGG